MGREAAGALPGQGLLGGGRGEGVEGWPWEGSPSLISPFDLH